MERQLFSIPLQAHSKWTGCTTQRVYGMSAYWRLLLSCNCIILWNWGKPELWYSVLKLPLRHGFPYANSQGFGKILFIHKLPLAFAVHIPAKPLCEWDILQCKQVLVSIFYDTFNLKIVYFYQFCASIFKRTPQKNKNMKILFKKTIIKEINELLMKMFHC